MTTTNWQANGNDGSEASDVIDFGLVDAKGRAIGTCLFVQPNFRGEYVDGTWTRTALGTFSYSIQSTRNGGLFGGIPRNEGAFATIDDAKAAAEKAAERSRKAQARKHGASVEEAASKKAEQSAKRAAKVAAWLAGHEARMAQRKAEAVASAVVEAAPVVEAVEAVEAAPAAKVSKLDAAHAFVEAEAARVLGRLRHVEPAVELAPVAEAKPEAVPVDADVARFRGYRDPDGALRFRKVEPDARPGWVLLDGRFLPWPAWLVVDGRRMTVDEERQLWHELDASDPALAKARRAELVAWHDTARGGPYSEPSSDAIARAERLAGA